MLVPRGTGYTEGFTKRNRTSCMDMGELSRTNDIHTKVKRRMGGFIPSRGSSSCRAPLMGASMEHSRTWNKSSEAEKKGERKSCRWARSCRALTIMERMVMLSLGQTGDLKASLRSSKRLGLVPGLSAIRGRVGIQTQAHLTAQSAFFAVTT